MYVINAGIYVEKLGKKLHQLAVTLFPRIIPNFTGAPSPTPPPMEIEAAAQSTVDCKLKKNSTKLSASLLEKNLKFLYVLTFFCLFPL